jgi:MFS family permease
LRAQLATLSASLRNLSERIPAIENTDNRSFLSKLGPRLRTFFTGLVPLFVLAHFSHHVVGALLTPLLPFIRDEFILTKTQLGFLGSAYNLPYGIGQLPGGWLADRIGPRNLIVVGISGVAAAGLLVGFSPSYVVIAIGLVLLGLAGGGYHPAASPLVSASVDERNRGSALGIHQIGGTASFFLTPLIAAGIAGAIGWRGTFYSLSIPTLIFGIVLYVLLGRRGYTGRSQPKVTDGSVIISSAKDGIRHLVPFTALGVVLQVLIFSSVSFAPVYAVDHLGASNEAAAGLLSVAHFAGLVAGPLGGYLSDRLGKLPVMLTVSLLAGPAIYLLNYVSFGWGLSLVLLLMGSCQYIGMPVSESYIIAHTSERNRSTVLGFYYFASRGGPGLVMPLMGYLFDKFSFEIGYSAVAITMVAVTIICALFLRRSRDQASQ